MKISKIKFKDDDPILKGLTLDFTQPNGSIYENIVLVGENGIGKTTIMNRIAAFFHDDSFDFDTFEYAEEGNRYVARQKHGDIFEVSKNGGAFEEAHISHKNDDTHNGGWIYAEMEETPNKRNASYSPAVSDFRSDGSGKSDVHSHVIKNLTTIQRQDYEKYYQQNTDNGKNGIPLMPVSQFDSHLSQMQRFKIAYNKVFEGLEFKGLHTEADKSSVLFIKDGMPIGIENLSTGEKQVVFRGSYLLSGSTYTSVALIDEPEISMHPCWQDKILDFYKSLYRDTATHQQKAQLFFATHSDIILANAVTSVADTKVLILKKEPDGRISCNSPHERVLPTPTLAETSYIIFRRYTTDYHIELFSHLHANIQSNRAGSNVSIKDVDDSIQRQTIYDASQHAKGYEHVHPNGSVTSYMTLSCFVRNSIDHPNSPDSHGTVQSHSTSELHASIDFLRELIKLQHAGGYDYTS